MQDESGIYLGNYTGTEAMLMGGKEVISINFDIVHKAVNGEWQTCGATFQRSIKIFCSDGVWNSEQAKQIMLDKLQSFGFNGDFENPIFSAESLTSPDGVQLECKYDGKYNNWDIVRETVPINAQAARVLNAKYKTAVGESALPASPPLMPANNKTPQGPPATTSSTPPLGAPNAEMPTGDEIPFDGGRQPTE